MFVSDKNFHNILLNKQKNFFRNMQHPVQLFSAIRGLSTYKPELEAGEDDLILKCDEQFSSANKCFSLEVKNTQDKNNPKVVGHLAKEVSRLVFKWLRRDGKAEVKIYDNFWGSKNEVQKSFRSHGLEVGCLLTFEADDIQHQKLLRRHFLGMIHKWDMSSKLLGSFSG